MFVLMN